MKKVKKSNTLLGALLMPAVIVLIMAASAVSVAASDNYVCYIDANKNEAFDEGTEIRYEHVQDAVTSATAVNTENKVEYLAVTLDKCGTRIRLPGQRKTM